MDMEVWYKGPNASRKVSEQKGPVHLRQNKKIDTIDRAIQTFPHIHTLLHWSKILQDHTAGRGGWREKGRRRKKEKEGDQQEVRLERRNDRETHTFLLYNFPHLSGHPPWTLRRNGRREERVKTEEKREERRKKREEERRKKRRRKCSEGQSHRRLEIREGMVIFSFQILVSRLKDSVSNNRVVFPSFFCLFLFLSIGLFSLPRLISQFLLFLSLLSFGIRHFSLVN
jgi:hypothetical protein